MAKLDRETAERNRELAQKFSAEKRAKEQEMTKFIRGKFKLGYYGHGDAGNKTEYLEKIICDDFLAGKFEKPSEFFEKKFPEIFGVLVIDRYKKHFLHAVDKVIECQYMIGSDRRSFRSKSYAVYCDRITNILINFMDGVFLDNDICDILLGNIPEDAKAYIKENDWPKREGYIDWVIAAELDFGNERLEKILEDIILGENPETALSVEIIRGIVCSSNKKLHELLCKLLVAARLQEGLRQAICENADYGTKEAFFAIFDTIIEHNLIRFSSVKRAVGTWVGFLSEEERDVDRISGKIVSLMEECLKNEEAREKYLFSDDAIELSVALWSVGFYNVGDAVRIAEKITERKQGALAAAFFANILKNRKVSEKLQKAAMRNHSGEYDIIAMCMLGFMKSEYSFRYFDILRGEFKISDYYEDREEAEFFYEFFCKNAENMKAKKLSISPCFFPWLNIELSRRDIMTAAAYAALSLGGEEKEEFVRKNLAEIDSDSRCIFFEKLYSDPETKEDRAVVIKAMGDKNERVSATAQKIAFNFEYSPEEYLILEDMLRYKTEHLRVKFSEILLRRSDEEIFESIERLISDKNEQKRWAALNFIERWSEDKEKAEMFQRCLPLLKKISEPTEKERMFIESFVPKEKKEPKKVIELRDEDIYCPKLNVFGPLNDCIETFMEYFPESKLRDQLRGKASAGIFGKLSGIFGSSECETYKQAVKDLKSLASKIGEHENDVYKDDFGNEMVLGDYYKPTSGTAKEAVELLKVIVDDWYKTINEPKRVFAARVLSAAVEESHEVTKKCKTHIDDIFGAGFSKQIAYRHEWDVSAALVLLDEKYVPMEEKRKISVAVCAWIAEVLPKDALLIQVQNGYFTSQTHFIAHPQVGVAVENIDCGEKDFAIHFPVKAAVSTKCAFAMIDCCHEGRETFSPILTYQAHLSIGGRYYIYPKNFIFTGIPEYIRAFKKGIIAKRHLDTFIYLKTNTVNVLSDLTGIYAFYTGSRNFAELRDEYGYGARDLEKSIIRLVGKTEDFTEEDIKLLEFAKNLCEEVVETVVTPEFSRGDAKEDYSFAITGIKRICGAEYFAKILAAVGNAPMGYCQTAKEANLFGLLKHCMPSKDDSAETLAKALECRKISRKRLVEAALYSNGWIDLIGEYLGIPGFKSACYYFIAHMKDEFTEKKKAEIARFTPLSVDELNLGAFDIEWFRNAYQSLGEKDFELVYNAAKYIANGAKHTRARKYADATTGKFSVSETEKEIAEKRNKDLFMAYPLIPLADEDDISRRYLFIQKFLKESKKFGQQRSASEAKCVEMALKNLAANAGFADENRLTLRMENKLIKDNANLFEPKAIEGVSIALSADEHGKTSIVCEKDGKVLKSVPAKIKKDEYVLKLTEMKKQFTEQHSRTKLLFERAMEDGILFTAEELSLLCENPISGAIIKNLVFSDGENFGFFSPEGLVTPEDEVVPLSTEKEYFAAHPFHLYKNGNWSGFQKAIFRKGIAQPFKQVFRELYVKTEDESEKMVSERYSGNQIQPKKTVSCLKGRRWVADIESGIQKIYYKENIVAHICAMADWFSPADIESPTLEYVFFTDRNTDNNIRISEVPDVIFSEVMRDVDLAVSVAHVGGIDPEASHSTVEMRKVILEFVLPMLKLKNVTIERNHAAIEGTRADYMIHLGSGVVHQKGGTMINVLPVHSQHRGKIFLPFVDDDPKTSEVISKIVFFAEDAKIKDPFILEQIIKG